MFLIFQILLILYGLYCFSFCSIFIYTAIVEEWCCQNRIPNLIKYIKRQNYQPVNENDINII